MFKDQEQSIIKMEWMVKFLLFEGTHNFVITFSSIYDNNILTSSSWAPTETGLLNFVPMQSTIY